MTEASMAGVRRVLAVVAHPDDESFGLGGVLDHLADGGVEVSVLCFTRGEASTLHGRPGDLTAVRAAEFEAAAGILKIMHTRLLSYPDTGLAGIALPELTTQVRTFATRVRPTHLVAFDLDGVTGHPDHVQATRAALAAAELLDLPLIGWAVPEAVAEALNAEFGTSFVGRSDREIDQTVQVDRTHQWQAIAAHASQSAENPVLRRRLKLLGDTEHLRALR